MNQEAVRAIPDRLRLSLRFSPSQLRSDLEHLRHSDWIAHFVRQNYEGDWSVLPLRGPRGAVHPIRMAYSDPGCSDFEDTPFLVGCSYLPQVLASFPFELHAVRLMSLSPGSRIKEHRDHDLSLEDGAIRLHIPITTSDSVEFHLNGQRIVMAEGECWYLRLSDPHAVFNGGAEDRVHRVVDAPASEAVHAFLRAELDRN
jgi:hypothetical protein